MSEILEKELQKTQQALISLQNLVSPPCESKAELVARVLAILRSSNEVLSDLQVEELYHTLHRRSTQRLIGRAVRVVDGYRDLTPVWVEDATIGRLFKAVGVRTNKGDLYLVLEGPQADIAIQDVDRGSFVSIMSQILHED